MLQFRCNGAQGLSLILHGLRRLSLSSTSSSTDATHSFIDYLVDSLGFSKQQSFSLSAKLTRVPLLQEEVLGDDENAIATVNRLHHRSIFGSAKNLAPNVALLRNYGIPLESIRKHIIKQPKVYIRKTKSLEEVLIRVEEKWGIPRDSPMFLYGVSLLGGLSEENIDSKVRVFTSFGWTESDVQALMKKHPNCLALSEARIKKSLEFLMNELGYKPDVIASRPTLLICSLEKRIIPRRKVLLVLKDKGLIRREYSLYGLVSLTEALFVKKFVLPYKEVHEVYAKLCGRPLQQLTQEKADSHSQL